MNFQVVDRLLELRYRLRSSTRAKSPTWIVTAADRARVKITWPSTYQWEHARVFVGTLEGALARINVLRVAPTPQIHRGIVRMFCTIDDRPHIIAIDYMDRPDAISKDALAECSLYIKFQHKELGYADGRIVPGGYSVSSPHYYRYYRAFRKRSVDDRRIDVLGRFSYKFQGELRGKAVEMLSRASDIHFVGAGTRVRYSRFLREVASARLSLDLPGNGPFTFRVPEFLGLGTCLISPRYVTALHEPLVPGVHYVAIADDLSDLLEKCRYYLAHEEERARIAKAGQEFFDRYLHCDHLASYFLRIMLDRLGNDRQEDYGSALPRITIAPSALPNCTAVTASPSVPSACKGNQASPDGSGTETSVVSP
jgi:hypothetical protein